MDYLKIDGSFIRDMLDDPMDMAPVESINQIGHVMGIKTIAEFVDNREKLLTLKTFGLDYTQGFYLHKPAPFMDLYQAPGSQEMVVEEPRAATG